jgi:hypothetical protein
VISEPGPGVAAAAGRHLEDVRLRFSDLGLPLRGEEKGPAVVLVFAGRASLDPYSSPDSRDPAMTRGLSLAGVERNWISVAWDAPGSAQAALAHEYAHLIRPDVSAALWFREGMAEYLAGLASGEEAAPPGRLHHLLALREEPWIAWEEFLGADRMSAAFSRRNFYSQAWLAVHWLAARGASAGELRPGGLESLVRAHGSEWMDSQLREHAELLWAGNLRVEQARAERLRTAGRREGPPEQAPSEAAGPAESIPGRLTDAWEVPFWKAEFHRELQQWERAKSALELLERQYPKIPGPSESLGAIAIAQGSYDLAEEKLHDALRKGSRRPLTHYQFSLMLLRPLDGADASAPQPPEVQGRALQAVSHARVAREANPHQPLYWLAEAQALAAAGIWNAAAERLSELGGFPGWRERSDQEFEELLRRRQQTLRGIPRPDGLAAAFSSGATRYSDATGEAVRLSAAMGGNPPLPRVLRPPPPPTPDPEPWPPPGTVLLYGYINGVECRDGVKIVTVKTPRFTIELRENAASLAKLYHPPKKWAELPCGLSGYEVNVVYRPLPPGGEVRGELVAVVF